MTEFPNKIWTRSGLEYLLKKIDTHASLKLLSGSGRLRTACTAGNVVVVEEFGFETCYLIFKYKFVKILHFIALQVKLV